MNDHKSHFTLDIEQDGSVIMMLDGVRHILGFRTNVCMQFEQFLALINHEFEPRFAGLTVAEWDKKWTDPEPLTGDFSQYRTSVGLYRAFMNGEIKYIGKACEHANGGLKKRLADYTRQSDSARKFGAGPLMHSNRNELLISLLVTGEGHESALIAEQMEKSFIELYRPDWNTHGSRNT